MATKYGQYDSIRLKGDLQVDEDANFDGDFAITGSVTITGAWTVLGALTVGISGTGEAVTFYGDNAGSDFVWAEAGDTNGSLTLGASTDNVDFRVYGKTAATYLHWDGSVDDLLLVGAASRISVAGTDETSSGTTGAINTAGGIGAAKKVFVGTDLLMAGGDIDMTTGATGTYDITLKTNMADALSIKDSAADLILFNTTTGTPVVTITPITTITGILTLSGGLAFGAAVDVTVLANTDAALEFAVLAGAAFMEFDTRNTITGASNVTITGVPASIVAAATVAKNTVSIVPGTTTFTGGTGMTTPLDGVALTIAAPAFSAATAAVTQASTVYIAGEPTISGGGSLTTAYAVEINSGNMLTAGQIIVSEATAASSLATGAVQVTGGIAVTGVSWFGADINLATGASDVVVIANTAAALEFSDATTKLLAFDTRNTVTGVSNATFTGAPATIASAATISKNTVSIVPGTTTTSGTTQTTTEMDGLALTIAAPTIAGEGGHTIDQASTVFIAAAPIASTLTITTGYALEIASGDMLTAGAVYVTRAALGATNDRAMKISSTQATPAMADGYGVIEKELTVTGTATTRVCGESSWLNLGTDAVIPSYTTVHNDGIWDGTATLTNARIAWAKYHCSLETNPADCALWELNFAGANSEIDAVFMVNDATLALGFEAGTPSQAATGSIPIFQTAGGGGGGPKYIYVYDSIA